MSRNTLFVVSLVVVGILSAGVAYGMFDVGKMDTFQMSKMYFAAAVLAFLAFIFLLAMIFYAVGPEPSSSSAESPGKVIFDACVKVIPPLVTLVIGFYFGSPKDEASINDKSATKSAVTSPASASSTAKK